MVDYHNPSTVAHESTELVNLWHVAYGIFIWEFFSTLGYEWDVIRERRPYRWTIWLYSITRAATLLSIILNMVGVDSTAPMQCQVWITFTTIFNYMASGSASLLIVLRIIAVWNMAKIPFVITMGVWVVDIGFLISGAVRIRSVWLPEANYCALLNIESTKPAIISTLVTDVVLLLIMLSGVLRLRLDAAGAFDLGHVLWKQGLNWLLLATVAELPPAVFMSLNLNEPLSIMFQTPSMIIMSIAATRMYRSLVDFGTPDSSRDIPQSGHMLSELRVRSGTVPPIQMEVSVRTMEGDQYPKT